MTQSMFFTGTSANASAGMFLRDVRVTRADKTPIDTKAVETAVYSYIQAKRSLGKTSINSVEIAGALSLPQKSVEGAIRALSAKGVKIKR